MQTYSVCSCSFPTHVRTFTCLFVVSIVPLKHAIVPPHIQLPRLIGPQPPKLIVKHAELHARDHAAARVGLDGHVLGPQHGVDAHLGAPVKLVKHRAKQSVQLLFRLL